MVLLLDSHKQGREVSITIDTVEAFGKKSRDCFITFPASEKPYIIF